MKPTEETTDEAQGGNAFEMMLRQHRNGLVADKASEKLLEAIECSRTRNAMSTVTITVKLKPQNDDQMIIEADVKNTLPKEKLPSGMMHVDDDNRLHTSDPRQKELPLREVTAPGAINETSEKEVKEA